MLIKIQAIALYTLIRREITRMLRIFSQVFLPPVITSTLYFLIFGSVIGSRIGEINGLSYPTFIAPGLIMMSVIINAYGNVSTSMFSARFQRNIEEMLVSPMKDGLMLTGFILGGIIRGLAVGILVYLVALCFVKIDIDHFMMTLLVIILVSSLFSLAGFTNAMVAKSFDNVMLIPTFVLTPLTYLGGVFYSVDMLSPFWQTVTHLNPIFYMVSALRHYMIGEQEVNMVLALGVIILANLLMLVVNLIMMKRGIGLRE